MIMLIKFPAAINSSESTEKFIKTDPQSWLISQNFKFCKPVIILVFSFFIFSASFAQSRDWYTEGKDNIPSKRVKITVTNPLNIPLKNQPVTVSRIQLPFQDFSDRLVSIVDPKLPSNHEPTVEELRKVGGYLMRKETNGHYIASQVDDIDKDGIWDEIFFLTDLAPRESRDFYLYIGFYERFKARHLVHGAVASYGRHPMVFLESEDMGWKLWYPHDLDLHGKRKPMLTASYEYETATSGYYMPMELGTDIMTVAKSFGAGGMCLFENPSDPENPARAYYSPNSDKGPFKNTRFAFDVIYNGPLRSMLKVRTMNWNSGKGFYELDQYYSVVANKSWAKVEVKFNKFIQPAADIMVGAGIRRIMSEYKSVNKGGMVISMGKDLEARIPDEDIDDPALIIPWEGIALVVKDQYKPQYVPIKNYGGNHLMKMPLTQDRSYEYLVFGGWSFGEVNNDEKEFIEYVEAEGLKYNNPPGIKIGALENKNP